MHWPFYITATIAVVSTLLVITSLSAVHALLNLVVSLLAVALVFYFLGASFAAALEVIVYAGAIMVLFVFVIMMLNLGPGSQEAEKQILSARVWAAPAALALILIAELAYILFFQAPREAGSGAAIGPKSVGLSLFGPYLIGVELASLLLLAALVGVFHLGRKDAKEE